MESLTYALVQIVHNFGAAGALGGSLFAVWPRHQPADGQRALAWLVLTSWSMQILSGVGLGLTSLYYYGQFPDIHGVALAALGVKIACAVFGLGVVAVFVARARSWDDWRRARTLRTSAWLAAVALAGAGVLRWYS